MMVFGAKKKNARSCGDLTSPPFRGSSSLGFSREFFFFFLPIIRIFDTLRRRSDRRRETCTWLRYIRYPNTRIYTQRGSVAWNVICEFTHGNASGKLSTVVIIQLLTLTVRVLFIISYALSRNVPAILAKENVTISFGYNEMAVNEFLIILLMI